MSKVWVLTEEYNEYDQHGAYFLAVFANKPTPTDLLPWDVSLSEAFQLMEKGNSREDRYQGSWFYLYEEELK